MFNECYIFTNFNMLALLTTPGVDLFKQKKEMQKCYIVPCSFKPISVHEISCVINILYKSITKMGKKYQISIYIRKKWYVFGSVTFKNKKALVYREKPESSSSTQNHVRKKKLPNGKEYIEV